MPNTPSSVAQTSTKKRKLSSASTLSAPPRNLSSIDVPLPQQPIQIGTDSAASKSISNGSGDHVNSEEADLDDSILNSEVYKIYCRERDPEVAMKKIKELKNCLSFVKSTKPFADEEVFKRACETTLDRLWKFSPHSGDSKFDKIRKFVNQDITLFELSRNSHDELIRIVGHNCFTRIRMLFPNGYVIWYIANFDEGPGKSKWYRVETTESLKGWFLALLNVMGLNNSAISKLHYDHCIGKNSKKREWIDFAKDVKAWTGIGRLSFESPAKESVTKCKVGVTVTLQTKYFTDDGWKVKKCYHGESTRRVTKKQKSQEVMRKHKAEMTKEAEKAALEEYFRERFGFTEFKDIVCDELSRPIKV